MLELLIAFGLLLMSKISIGDIISLTGLAKGLVGRIGEKDASKILKKALNETIKQSEDTEAKEILNGLKKNDEILRELQKLDVSEESRKSFVSQYFNGREDVFDDLAKNYYMLFCKEATKKDGTFKEFVVIELGKLASQGIITNEAIIKVGSYLEGIKTGIAEIKEDTTEIKERVSRIEEIVSKPEFYTCLIEEQRECIEKIKTSWLKEFSVPFEKALKLQNKREYREATEIISEILKDVENKRIVHRDDENFIIEREINAIETLCFFNLGLNSQFLEKHLNAVEFYKKTIFLAEILRFKSDFIAGNYNNRGNAYAKSNKHEKAIEDYNKAIELNPDDATAYNNRGNTYAKSNKHEKAIEDYNKAIELNPDYATAYNNRGAAYAKSNKHEKAIEDYNKAIELNPDDATAYNNRGAAYAKSNKHEKAIEDYNKAIELNPDFSEIHANRGITYSKIGKYEESARDLKKAGISFFFSGRVDDSVKANSLCFKLQDKIENDDVVYCGLILFLITLNADVIIELRKMKIQDETLRKIFELAVRKLRNRDISEGLAEIEEQEKREEMRFLLGLLKGF